MENKKIIFITLLLLFLSFAIVINEVEAQPSSLYTLQPSYSVPHDTWVNIPVGLFYENYDEITITWNDPINGTQEVTQVLGQPDWDEFEDQNRDLRIGIEQTNINAPIYFYARSGVDYNQQITVTYSDGQDTVSQSFNLNIPHYLVNINQKASIPDFTLGSESVEYVRFDQYFEYYSEIKLEFYDPIANENVTILENIQGSIDGNDTQYINQDFLSLFIDNEIITFEDIPSIIGMTIQAEDEPFITNVTLTATGIRPTGNVTIQDDFIITILDGAFPSRINDGLPNINLSFESSISGGLNSFYEDYDEVSLSFPHPTDPTTVNLNAEIGGSIDEFNHSHFDVKLEPTSNNILFLFQSYNEQYSEQLEIELSNEFGSITDIRDFTIESEPLEPPTQVGNFQTQYLLDYNDELNLSMNQFFDNYETISVSFPHPTDPTNQMLQTNIDDTSVQFIHNDIEVYLISSENNINLIVESQESDYNETFEVNAINPDGSINDTFQLTIEEDVNPPIQTQAFTDITIDFNDFTTQNLDNFFNNYDYMTIYIFDSDANQNIELTSESGNENTFYQNSNLDVTFQLNPSSHVLTISAGEEAFTFEDVVVQAFNQDGFAIGEEYNIIIQQDPPTIVEGIDNIDLEFNQQQTIIFNEHFDNYDEISLNYFDNILNDDVSINIDTTESTNDVFQSPHLNIEFTEGYITFHSQEDTFSASMTITASNSGGEVDDEFILSISPTRLISVGGSNNVLYRFDRFGDLVWSFSEHTGIIWSTYIDHLGFFYSTSSDGTTKKINIDGQQQWSYAVGGSVRTVYVDNDQFVYTGGTNNELHKISPQGNNVWINNDPTGTVQTVLEYNNLVFFGGVDNVVRLVDTNTGGNIISETFTGHTGSINDLSADDDGFIYTASVDNTVRKLADDLSTQIWSYGDIGSTTQSVEWNNGYVYVGANNNRVTILEDDGSFLWESPDLGFNVLNVEVDSSGFIYASGSNEVVRLFDPTIFPSGEVDTQFSPSFSGDSRALAFGTFDVGVALPQQVSSFQDFYSLNFLEDLDLTLNQFFDNYNHFTIRVDTENDTFIIGDGEDLTTDIINAQLNNDGGAWILTISAREEEGSETVIVTAVNEAGETSGEFEVVVGQDQVLQTQAFLPEYLIPYNYFYEINFNNFFNNEYNFIFLEITPLIDGVNESFSLNTFSRFDIDEEQVTINIPGFTTVIFDFELISLESESLLSVDSTTFSEPIPDDISFNISYQIGNQISDFNGSFIYTFDKDITEPSVPDGGITPEPDPSDPTPIEFPSWFPSPPSGQEPFWAMIILIGITALVSLSTPSESFLARVSFGTVTFLGLFLLFSVIGWIPLWIGILLLVITILIIGFMIRNAVTG